MADLKVVAAETQDSVVPIDLDKNKIHLWSGTDLLGVNFPPQPQIVKGLIERGNLVILAGPPKAGKSFFTLDLATSVAKGETFLTEHETEPGDTLLLALEDTTRRVSNRLKRIVGSDHKAIDRMHVLTQAVRMGEGGMGLLKEWIAQVPNPSLIIIDTLIRFRPWDTIGGGYTNDSLAMIPLHALAQENNLTIMVVHHDIKAASSSWENTISGSKGLTGIADGMMLLKKPNRKQQYGKLYATGRDIEETTYNVLFDPAHCRWYKCEDQEMEEDELGGEGEYVPTPLESKILTYMRGLKPGAIVTPKDIEAATGIGTNSIKPSLTKLYQEQLIVRLQRGQYLAKVEEPA